MNDNPPSRQPPSRWPRHVMLISLAVLTLGATIVMVNGWVSIPATHISGTGLLALAGGVLISFLVGGGLMALVFYSARNGYDDASQTPFKPAKPNDDTFKN